MDTDSRDRRCTVDFASRCRQPIDLLVATDAWRDPGEYCDHNTKAGDGGRHNPMFGASSVKQPKPETASGEEDGGVMRHRVMQPNGSRGAFAGGSSVAEIWLMAGIW